MSGQVPGLKDLWLKRNGKELIYEHEFINEEFAKMAKDLLKTNLPRVIPTGFDKLVDEVKVKQDGNKLLIKYIFKDEKSAECMFYLMRKVAGDGNAEKEE